MYVICSVTFLGVMLLFFYFVKIKILTTGASSENIQHIFSYSLFRKLMC